MGGNWRMPTNTEFQELFDNCDITWTDDYNGTGVTGVVFTSKVNKKSVFFPAAGYGKNSSVDYVGSFGNYWSASWGSSSSAWKLFFDSRSQYTSVDDRRCGCSVRAVCE